MSGIENKVRINSHNIANQLEVNPIPRIVDKSIQIQSDDHIQVSEETSLNEPQFKCERQFIKFYRKKIIQNPNDCNLYLKLGKHFLMHGKSQKATQQFSIAYELKPQQCNSIIKYLFNHKKKEISQIYTEAIKRTPKDSILYVELAQLYIFRRGQMEMAIQTLNQLIKNIPQQLTAYYYLGIILSKINNQTQILKSAKYLHFVLQKVVSTNIFLSQLAVYFNKLSIIEISHHFQKLEVTPQHFTHNIIVILELLGITEGQINQFDKMLKGNLFQVLYYNIIPHSFKSDQSLQLFILVEELIDLKSDNQQQAVKWITKLSKLYFQSFKHTRNIKYFSKAVATIEHAIQMCPKQLQLYALASEYWLQDKGSQNYYERIISLHQQIIKIDNKNYNSHILISQSYYNLSNVKKCRQFALKAQQIKSQNYQSYKYLILAANFENDFDEAIRCSQTMLSKVDQYQLEQGDIYYLVGKVYLGKGDPVLAAQYFKKELLVCPDNTKCKDLVKCIFKGQSIITQQNQLKFNGISEFTTCVDFGEIVRQPQKQAQYAQFLRKQHQNRKDPIFSFNISIYYNFIEDFQRSNQYFSEAIELTKQKFMYQPLYQQDVQIKNIYQKFIDIQQKIMISTGNPPSWMMLEVGSLYLKIEQECFANKIYQLFIKLYLIKNSIFDTFLAIFKELVQHQFDVKREMYLDFLVYFSIKINIEHGLLIILMLRNNHQKWKFTPKISFIIQTKLQESKKSLNNCWILLFGGENASNQIFWGQDQYLLLQSNALKKNFRFTAKYFRQEFKEFEQKLYAIQCKGYHKKGETFYQLFEMIRRKQTSIKAIVVRLSKKLMEKSKITQKLNQIIRPYFQSQYLVDQFIKLVYGSLYYHCLQQSQLKNLQLLLVEIKHFSNLQSYNFACKLNKIFDVQNSEMSSTCQKQIFQDPQSMLQDSVKSYKSINSQHRSKQVKCFQQKYNQQDQNIYAPYLQNSLQIAESNSSLLENSQIESVHFLSSSDQKNEKSEQLEKDTSYSYQTSDKSISQIKIHVKFKMPNGSHFENINFWKSRFQIHKTLIKKLVVKNPPFIAKYYQLHQVKQREFVIVMEKGEKLYSSQYKGNSNKNQIQIFLDLGRRHIFCWVISLCKVIISLEQEGIYQNDFQLRNTLKYGQVFEGNDYDHAFQIMSKCPEDVQAYKSTILLIKQYFQSKYQDNLATIIIEKLFRYTSQQNFDRIKSIFLQNKLQNQDYLLKRQLFKNMKKGHLQQLKQRINQIIQISRKRINRNDSLTQQDITFFKSLTQSKNIDNYAKVMQCINKYYYQHIKNQQIYLIQQLTLTKYSFKNHLLFQKCTSQTQMINMISNSRSISKYYTLVKPKNVLNFICTVAFNPKTVNKQYFIVHQNRGQRLSSFDQIIKQGTLKYVYSFLISLANIFGEAEKIGVFHLQLSIDNFIRYGERFILFNPEACFKLKKVQIISPKLEDELIDNSLKFLKNLPDKEKYGLPFHPINMIQQDITNVIQALQQRHLQMFKKMAIGLMTAVKENAKSGEIKQIEGLSETINKYKSYQSFADQLEDIVSQENSFASGFSLL